jgi:hypothetical protein
VAVSRPAAAERALTRAGDSAGACLTRSVTAPVGTAPEECTVKTVDFAPQAESRTCPDLSVTPLSTGFFVHFVADQPAGGDSVTLIPASWAAAAARLPLPAGAG